MPQRTISKSKNRSGTAKAKLKKKITRKKERKEKREVQYEAAMISLASSLQASGVSRADFRKAQILEVVVKMAADEGFEAISFDRIGSALNLQKSNVAYYFESKEDMIEKAMHYALTRGLSHVVDGLKNQKPGQDQLFAYIDAHFSWLKFHFQHGCVILLTYIRSPADKLARFFAEQTKQGGRARIKSILQEIKREDSGLKESEINELAEFIQDYLTGIFVSLVSCGAPTSQMIDEKQKHVKKIISKIIKI
jgi:AcrR family transcriptional regulator